MMQPQLFAGLTDMNKNRYVIHLKVSPTTKFTADEIIVYICIKYNIQREVLESKLRKREVVVARQICCYFLQKRCKLPLKTIGRLFGGRDHSTVIYAINTINDLMDTQKAFKQEIKELDEEIKFNKFGK